MPSKRAANIDTTRKARNALTFPQVISSTSVRMQSRIITKVMANVYK
jgi:hypothetical protein